MAGVEFKQAVTPKTAGIWFYQRSYVICMNGIRNIGLEDACYFVDDT